MAANGSLLPASGGGITEWVKTEDLERMQAYAEYDSYGPDARQSEETFDIF